MIEHLNNRMLCLQDLYKQLDEKHQQDYRLNSAVVNDMTTRKKSILNVLSTNQVDFHSRINLESKIVQIDNRLAKAQGSVSNYKNRILSVLNIVKFEMFKIDDLLLLKLQQD
jgi:hypothetical protein